VIHRLSTAMKLSSAIGSVLLFLAPQLALA